MNITTYGLDVAKRVFQMYCVDAQTGEILNRWFGREELIAFLGQRPAGRVALEACGSGHCWARKIKSLGHQAVLLHAKFIRPFVQTNKTDAADARAIWTALQQPGMRTVVAKTEDQQAMLSLHRMRAQLVKIRTMQVNQLHGLLYELGVTFRAGCLAGLSEIRRRMAELEATLPGMVLSSLQDQLKRIDELGQEIERLEKQMGTWQKQEASCRAITAIPGIGRLTATALVATIGDARTFKSGREFASFLGLVPRQSGTGGKVRPIFYTTPEKLSSIQSHTVLGRECGTTPTATRGCAALQWRQIKSYLVVTSDAAVRTVGGRATPVAWNSLLQTPPTWLRSKNSLFPWTTWTSSSPSKSRMMSAHSKT